MCSGRPGRREGPHDLTSIAPIPAPLPLLLWKTPPGLELILAQEGVAVRGRPRRRIRSSFRGGRFVLFDGRHESARVASQRCSPPSTSRSTSTRSAAASPSTRSRPWSITRRPAASWIVGLRKLTERVSRHAQGADPPSADRPPPRRRSRRPAGSGSGWRRSRIRIARPSTSGPTSTSRSPTTTSASPGPRPAGRLLHPLREHPRLRHDAAVLRDLEGHDTQSHGHFHHVYRDPEANRVTWSGPTGSSASFGFEPVGLRRAARAVEPGPRRRPGGPRLPVLVRLPARLRRLPVLPLEGRPVLAGAPGPGASGLRGPLPRRRRRRRPGDRRATSRASSPRRSTRASRPSSTAIPSAGSAGCPRSCRRWRRTVDGELAGLAGDARPSSRAGGAGGPSGGGWSCPATDHRSRSSSTTGTPSTPSRWRSTAATSSARSR